MQINNLYLSNESISIQTYLQKHNVQNIQQFLSPKTSYVESFEHYDFYEQAYAMFFQHINNKSTICLYADIDNDGFCAYSIMYQYIKSLDPNIKIITVFNAGKVHGITDDIIQTIKDNKCKLFICPDAGASQHKEHKIIHDLGCDLLIFEHHESDKYNEWSTIVSNQLSPNVQNKYACGASIVFKFVLYCNQKQKKKMGKKYIDLCAFGIIGDVMMLNELENRVFVYYGLRNITNPMLKALVEEFIDTPNITPKDVSFNIVPKINATIRQNIYDNKLLLLKAMRGDNINCKEVLDMCKKAHSQQTYQVKKMYEQILPTVDNSKKVVIAFCDKTNYTGLVCNKILSATNKPVLLVHEEDGILSGSARAPFDFKDTLGESGLMTVNNGHGAAWGVAFKTSNLQDLKDYIDTLDITTDTIENVVQSYSAYKIPNELFGIFDDYHELFGQGLPEPKYHIHSIKLNTKKDIELLGKYGTTIKFTYKNIDYYIEYRSKVWKQEHHITDNIDLEIEVLGTLHLGKDGRKWVKIEKWEQKEIEPEILTWQDLF